VLVASFCPLDSGIRYEGVGTVSKCFEKDSMIADRSTDATDGSGRVKEWS